jgi:hypothetical protein
MLGPLTDRTTKPRPEERVRLPVMSCASRLLTLTLLPLFACGSGSGSSFGLSRDGAAPGDASRPHGEDASDGKVKDVSSIILPGSPDGASTVDASSCQHLNIGILGNPGALTAADFAGWLESAGTSVTTIQTTSSVPLTAAAIAPFDVIVLDHLTRSYTASETAIFSAWVASGGGVASMSGFTGSADDFYANSLLAPLGVQYVTPPPLLSGPVTDFAVHPTVAGLTSITFEGGWAIAGCPPGEICLAGACSSACSDSLDGGSVIRTPIAFLPSGGSPATVAVGVAVTMGAGHAFVWGDEWIEYDTVWSSDPQVEPFWVQIFAWIAPPHRCALAPPK